VYRRCLFCTADLGANDALPFAVGRRFAFDEAKGRLWVICPTCARWNLTPLEERWEAIEEAERLYRATRRRVATDHIGLADVGGAVELVRIGEPLRPEFAAWRYGAEFLKRRTKALVFGAVDAAVTLGVMAAAGAAGMAGIAFNGTSGGLGQLRMLQERRRGGTPLRLPDGAIVRVFSFSAANAMLVRQPDGSVGLRVAGAVPRDDRPWATKLGLARAYRDAPWMLLTSEQALPILRTLLPFANGSGARRRVVDAAVGRLERQQDVRALLHESIPVKGGNWSIPDRPLFHVEADARLALEMALHEDDERAALEGELQALEDRWRQAEEIAAIADDLLLPDGVRARVERGRSASGAAGGEPGGAGAP
jgi:hypothetical protein